MFRKKISKEEELKKNEKIRLDEKHKILFDNTVALCTTCKNFMFFKFINRKKNYYVGFCKVDKVNNRMDNFCCLSNSEDRWYRKITKCSEYIKRKEA